MKKLINLIILIGLISCTPVTPFISPSGNEAVKAELIAKIKDKVKSDQVKKLLTSNLDLNKLSLEQLEELDKKVSVNVSPIVVISASPVASKPTPFPCTGSSTKPCVPSTPEPTS